MRPRPGEEDVDVDVGAKEGMQDAVPEVSTKAKPDNTVTIPRNALPATTPLLSFTQQAPFSPSRSIGRASPAPSPSQSDVKPLSKGKGLATAGQQHLLRKKAGRLFTARDFARLDVSEEWEDL